MMETVENVIGNDLNAFLKKHPQMQLEDSSGNVWLSGKINVESADGYIWETFDVRVLIPPCYPNCFPLVWETSEIIPRDIDWHVTTDEGKLCLAVEPEERLLCIGGITLNWFMDKVLIPHFAAQKYKLEFDRYPHGERAHGFEGIRQYYLDLFETKDFDLVLNFIALGSLGISPKADEMCLCGSRKKFINCHAKAYSTLLKLGKDYLRMEIGKLTTKG